MTDVKTLGRGAWRDWNTDGVPSSGQKEPLKSEIREFVDAVAEDIGITRNGAVGDRSTDNLAAVNAAIARIGVGDLPVAHGGDFVVSGLPTNPLGVRLVGDGKILLPETGGFRQLNTYADRDLLVGREYLYRAFRRVSLGPAGVSTQLKVFVYGDSTVEGYVAPPSTLPVEFLVQNLLPRLFREQGIHNVSVTNRGHSGDSWTHLNAIPDLGANTDLFIIKYGGNDGVPLPGETTIEQRAGCMAGFIDEKLSGIRSAPYGGLDQLAILIVGPNSMNDTPNGRNEEWFEVVRNICVDKARKYHCAYVDAFAYMRDARAAASLWMDEPPLLGTGYTVHPLDIGNAWIWGKVIAECFPKTEVAAWASNSFTNIGSTGRSVEATKAPNEYDFGMTWEHATVANGFPVEGILVTYRNPDTYAVQSLYPIITTRRSFRRYAASGSAWDTIWAGKSETLTLANSWAALGSGAADPKYCLTSSGLVVLQGTIEGGTTTPGTVLATLPEGYRPQQVHNFVVASSGGTSVVIAVSWNGEVSLVTTGDATWTSLAGISFMAI